MSFSEIISLYSISKYNNISKSDICDLYKIYGNKLGEVLEEINYLTDKYKNNKQLIHFLSHFLYKNKEFRNLENRVEYAINIIDTYGENLPIYADIRKDFPDASEDNILHFYKEIVSLHTEQKQWVDVSSFYNSLLEIKHHLEKPITE